MFGFSLIQGVHQHAHRMDNSLRHHLVTLYKPFRFIPCFLHGMIENMYKKLKKVSVVVEFDKDEIDFSDALEELHFHIGHYRKSKIKDEYQHIHCCSVDVTPESLFTILEHCLSVKRIHLDRDVKAMLDVATPSIHAKHLTLNQKKLTGKGVTVAILDTGIYEHEDLRGRIIDFKDFIRNRNSPYDDNGHGTHCAGDACGNGLASGGRYSGPATDASLIGIKVLNWRGEGRLTQILNGLEWCLNYNESHQNKIDVISMSLGSTPQKYKNETDDPLVKQVNALWDNGIVVCAAAGNNGPEPKTITSPGLSRKIITVGAMDDNNTFPPRSDDVIAPFSSRGPTIYDVVKPDIVTPGVNIISLRSPGAYLDKSMKQNRIDRVYFSLSGTSMATPICAGVVAQLLESNPKLTPDAVKEKLKGAGESLQQHEANVFGAGYLDATLLGE